MTNPVAVVRHLRTGGNVGVSWQGIPTDFGEHPNEGSFLYIIPDPLMVEITHRIEEAIILLEGRLVSEAIEKLKRCLTIV